MPTDDKNGYINSKLSEMWERIQDRVILPFERYKSKDEDHQENVKDHMRTCNADRQAFTLRINRLEDFREEQEEAEKENRARMHARIESKRWSITQWIAILTVWVMVVGVIIQAYSGKH